MRQRYLIILSIVLLLLLTFISFSAYPQEEGKDDQKNDTILFETSDTTYCIFENINLNDRKLKIPSNCTLDFRGGSIRGGVIVGNKTRITGDIKGIFNNVIISGTWCVNYISSSMFDDVYNSISLKSLFSLASDNVLNTIVIEGGTYNLTCDIEEPDGLIIPSRTNLILHGDIKLEPNSLSYSSIFLVQNADSVTIYGNGHIYGDFDRHLGKKGEWGMGVKIFNSRDVIVRDISISNCWGDGIYISGESEHVTIHKCNISKCRRQGISITSAKNVDISDCAITGIGGTAPGCGIDVEPNKYKVVSNIKISNSFITNCQGGFSCSGKAEGSLLNEVEILNCTIKDCDAKYTLAVGRLSNAIIKGCNIYSENRCAIRSRLVDGLSITDNSVHSTNKEAIMVLECSNFKNINNIIFNYR